MEGELDELERHFSGERFWRLVQRMKAEPELARIYGDRLAEIDARRFGRYSISLRAGTVLMLLLLPLSALLFLSGAELEGTLKVALFLIATLMLMASLHTLAHLAAGKMLGIRFLYYFPDGPARVEPTLKVHYGSYLRATPLSRGLLHLSGIFGSIAGSLLGLLVALRTAQEAVPVLALLFLLNIPFEFSPPILVRLGFRSFRKSDAYRAFRELRQVRR